MPDLNTLRPACQLTREGGDRSAAGAAFKTHAVKMSPSFGPQGLARTVRLGLFTLVGKAAGRSEGAVH
ncbi:hypothetical protein GCM10007920_46530 [Ciceribacter naphthalenivorans]|uniref:Uncharacterized protein n=1 Tax=Sphingomonas psychrolutea TaxID=1259676 RepID=A0ABQ6EK81_9SPHN|nr:hypothetical protein GCM10007920_46530 [Ciceribacter naphthalenivorans]GLT07715.1 hypothetical protein GCM10007926_46530 [Sphingomonas psychrolutea]